MRPAFLFVAAIWLCVLVHVGVMALVGWQVGVTVEEVSFFFGPTLFRLRYRGVSYRVGAIPMGGFVKFKGERGNNTDPEQILFAADMEPPGFRDLHPLKQSLISASGCVALLALAALCLGPWAAVRSLSRGFVQLIPFAPWTPAWVPGGRELVGRLMALFQQGPFRVALGVMAAKLAAFNLLPLPPSNGGMILASMLGWKRGLPENVVVAMTYVGLCVLLTLYLYWIVQIGTVLLQLF
jgi:membrane-associated protease RseP (regulator of RpoE activity)